MATIKINNLGAVQSVEIDIKKFNLFVGEQATGKSTICKAVYYFRNFKEVLSEYLYNIVLSGKKETTFPGILNTQMKDTFIRLFGYSWELPDDLYIEYEFSDSIWIKVNLEKKKKKYLSINHSPDLIKQVKKLESEAAEFYRLHLTEDSMSSHLIVEQRNFFAELQEKILTILGDDMMTYYLPAGRSMMSLLANQKTKLNYEDLETLNRIFIQRIESLQSKFAEGITQVHRHFPAGSRKFDVKEMSETIIKGMKGEYFCQGNREYLLTEDKKERVPINFTSSGQQEILWLYNQLYVLMLRDEKAFVIVEEPEAHLYPVLQRNILDFIVTYINLTGGSVIVTTHSPYILTECNNLCYAGKLKQEQGLGTQVEKIVGKWNYLKKDDVNAFKLRQAANGTEVFSLIDKETGELLAEKIDEISEEINQVYTELYYLEENDDIG